MKKVNFGSGNVSPRGWISLDSSPSVILAKMPYANTVKKLLHRLNLIDSKVLGTAWPKNIKFWDLRWGVPFKNNSVDIIFASHFLEHLPKRTAEKFLRKCFYILKSGGTIRLIVPDIDIVLKRYLEDYKTNAVAAGEEFNTRLFENGQHKWMYNLESLSDLLAKSGFKRIRKMSFRKSKIKDINNLETPNLKYYTSLYVEAEK